MSKTPSQAPSLGLPLQPRLPLWAKLAHLSHETSGFVGAAALPEPVGISMSLGCRIWGRLGSGGRLGVMRNLLGAPEGSSCSRAELQVLDSGSRWF